MIGDLRDIRTQLLIVAGVLLLFDVAAIAVLLSPAGRSRGAQEQFYEQLRLEKITKSRAALATRGMEEKIATAREQEATFNQERLASRYSAMSEQLSRMAAAAGVKVTDVKYDERTGKEVPPPGYEPVGITVQVHGSYAQDMRFINEMERQKMLLLIDVVGFSGMTGEELTVSIHLSTYLRSAA
jgi:hypothetical protein